MSPPPDVRTGTKHWARVSSNVRQIGESNGVFVNFGGEDMNMYSGVVRGRGIENFAPGDKLRIVVNRTFYHAGKETWKFELGFGSDDQVRFPLIRDGYIIVPKEKMESAIDGAIPERFADYVQPNGKDLDSSDPPARIRIRAGFYKLLGPEGINEIITEITSGKPFEMLVLEERRSSGGYYQVPVAHPKFPAVHFGFVEVSPREERITGGKVRCVFKASAGNPAHFFEVVLRGGLIFEYVKPTLQDMATDEGVSVEFIEALQRPQMRMRAELVLIEETGIARTQFGLEEHWPLALPEFPDRKIGFAPIHRWHKLGVGDRATFVPSAFSINEALRGRQFFTYIPKKFVSGQAYQAEVAPPSGRDGYSDLVRAYIKGHHPVAIPICFLPEAKEGELVDVLTTTTHMEGWPIAIPCKAYSAALELQQMLQRDTLEVEISGDYCRTWCDLGYFARLKVGEYSINVYLSTGETKGFKPGDKIAVKVPSPAAREEFKVFEILLYNLKQLRFELAD